MKQITELLLRGVGLFFLVSAWPKVVPHADVYGDLMMICAPLYAEFHIQAYVILVMSLAYVKSLLAATARQ